ncbi:MAG: hypothetical protein ABIK09_07890 [Pseudomonadota bacterium]
MRNHLSLLVLLAAACAGPGPGPAAPVLDADPPEDVAVEPAGDVLGDAQDGVVDTGDLLDGQGADRDTGDHVVGPWCDPGEGCFMDLCVENEDCLSGWCVLHRGEGVCSMECQEDCPQGWTCRPLMATAPDIVYICVSDYANLCLPCASAADCASTGGAQDACVDYGPGGAFCGGPCGDAQACPAGTLCQEVTTVGGAVLEQCIHSSGECPCTASSVALGLASPCHEENDAGTCTGTRVCTASGLTDCDAAIPGAETCNGVDDDCDGGTDEPDLVEGDYVNLCADGDPCTLDKCMGAQGCVWDTLEAGSSDDGDPCTLDDHCGPGGCVGAPVACDDGDSCTDDLCEGGACVFPPNAVPCDDADPCTVDDACSDGACAGTPAPCGCMEDGDCAELEDGNACNGTLVCDAAVNPHVCAVDSDTLVSCPAPGGPCLAALCAPGTGDCLAIPADEGAPCDDGDACTQGDACVGGICTGLATPPCDDGNPCTDDACAPLTGCVFTSNDDPCSDGDACTVGDGCADGGCQPGASLDCDDGDACDGLETCEPAAGCVPGVPLSCDDGDPCDGVETCAPVSGCVDGTPLGCDDGNPCTDDSCVSGVGCAFAFNSVPCDDGLVCTVGDLCVSGTCVGPEPKGCDDGDPCTDDVCVPGLGCFSFFNAASCDDGDACTTGDHCQVGVCTPLGGLDCDDGSDCTEDSCDPGAGCVNAALAGPCDDGDACTLGDQCYAGDCVGGASLGCDDGDPCTQDVCNVLLGCLHGPAAGTPPCDDGDGCTTGDTCKAGVCTPGAGCGTFGAECVDDACVAACPAWSLVDDHFAAMAVNAWVSDIMEVAPGQLVLSGQTSAFSGAAGDMTIFLLDLDAGFGWHLVHGSPGVQENNQAVALLASGEIVAAGSRSGGSIDGYVLGASSAGAFLWDEVVNLSAKDFFNDVAATADGGWVLAGRTYEGFWDMNVLAQRRSADGGVIWSVALGGGLNEEALAAVELPGGPIVLAGVRQLIGDDPQGLLLALDDEGNVSWETLLPKKTRFADLLVLPGGDLLATGSIWESGPTSSHVYIVRVSPGGEVLEQITSVSGTGDVATLTSDGNLAVLNTTADEVYVYDAAFALDTVMTCGNAAAELTTLTATTGGGLAAAGILYFGGGYTQWRPYVCRGCE